MNACFLDTSAAIDLVRRRNSALLAVAAYTNLLMPFAVMGELVAGIQKTANPVAGMGRLEKQTSGFQVVRADKHTSYVYGELLADLERRGQRIPTNDTWIAAVAVQFDLPLLARDEHFRRLPRLRWVGY